MTRCLFILAFLFGSMASAQFSPANSPSYSVNWFQAGELCDYTFLGMYRFISPSPRIPVNYLLDRNGKVVWYYQSSPWMLDFKLHPNGMMSFNQNDRFYLMDSTFNIVDSLTCDGYNTDVHDLIIREDGHFFVICFEDTLMDLSSRRTRNGTPGDTSAYVLGNVIQEMAPNKTSIRTWHTLDYFDPVADLDSLFWTNPAYLDFTHTNSLDLDDQGHVLLSHRNVNEVTLIDWASGDIRWRFSGSNNQFSMPNDIGLSAQHDARFLPGGRISVFDNGNFHSTVMSRGVIYEMDTLSMTANKVWEYSRNTARSTSLGSFRVLPNGNRLINWGAFNPETEPQISLVGADSSLIMQMDFQNSYWTYRAQCFSPDFAIPRPTVTCQVQNNQVVLSVDGSHSEYYWSTGETSPSITLADTGSYQVFVPLGIGMVGSEPLRITDLNAACPAVSSPEAVVPTKRRRLIGTWDMLGRPVGQRKNGELYIERYDDGSSRKVMSGFGG